MRGIYAEPSPILTQPKYRSNWADWPSHPARGTIYYTEIPASHNLLAIFVAEEAAQKTQLCLSFLTPAKSRNFSTWEPWQVGQWPRSSEGTNLAEGTLSAKELQCLAQICTLHGTISCAGKKMLLLRLPVGFKRHVQSLTFFFCVAEEGRSMQQRLERLVQSSDRITKTTKVLPCAFLENSMQWKPKDSDHMDSASPNLNFIISTPLFLCKNRPFSWRKKLPVLCFTNVLTSKCTTSTCLKIYWPRWHSRAAETWSSV